MMIDKNYWFYLFLHSSWVCSKRVLVKRKKLDHLQFGNEQLICMPEFLNRHVIIFCQLSAFLCSVFRFCRQFYFYILRCLWSVMSFVFPAIMCLHKLDKIYWFWIKKTFSQESVVIIKQIFSLNLKIWQG